MSIESVHAAPRREALHALAASLELQEQRRASVAVVEGELALPAAATQVRIEPTLVRREADDASERMVVEADVAATALVGGHGV